MPIASILAEVERRVVGAKWPSRGRVDASLEYCSTTSRTARSAGSRRREDGDDRWRDLSRRLGAMTSRQEEELRGSCAITAGLSSATSSRVTGSDRCRAAAARLRVLAISSLREGMAAVGSLERGSTDGEIDVAHACASAAR